MATCYPLVYNEAMESSGRDAFTRRRVLALSWGVAVAAAMRGVPAAEAGSRTLTIFAAASLVDVLTALAAPFEKAHGAHVEISAAASSALARQIEAGARADVFVSADQAWMDYLAERQLIEPSTRRDVAGNTLVLVAPAASDVRVELTRGVDLAAALGDGRLAVGEVGTVPAGRYARSALIALGAWEGVKDRLASTDNVRSALAFVARGEAPLGIVYATDAQIEPRVRIVDSFPEGTHERITYPAAAVKGAGPLAVTWLEWLRTPASQAVFRRYGFVV